MNCRRIQLKRDFSIAKAKVAGDEEAAKEAEEEKAAQVLLPAPLSLASEDAAILNLCCP